MKKSLTVHLRLVDNGLVNTARYEQRSPPVAELNALKDLYVGRDAIAQYASNGEPPESLRVTIHFGDEEA